MVVVLVIVVVVVVVLVIVAVIVVVVVVVIVVVVVVVAATVIVVVVVVLVVIVAVLAVVVVVVVLTCKYSKNKVHYPVVLDPPPVCSQPFHSVFKINFDYTTLSTLRYFKLSLQIFRPKCCVNMAPLPCVQLTLVSPIRLI